MVAQLARLLCVASLLWPSIVLAGFPSKSSFNSAVVYNAITDFGLVCNGVNDDEPALDAARNKILANPRVRAGAPVTIIFPPGSNCQFKSCRKDGMFFGIKNRTFIATGATMSFGASGCTNWGESNFWNDINGANSPNFINQRANAVNAGDQCVTMTVAGSETNYTVGKWVILSGFGLQTSSFPPNYAFYNYLQIASIDTTAHQLCFTAPALYTLETRWPDWGVSSCSRLPCGGPPWVVGQTYTGTPASGLCQRFINNNQANGSICEFDQTITFIGGTWNATGVSGFFVGGARNIRFENITWTSPTPGCPYPTGTMNYSWVNVTMTICNVEADKEVQNWTISGGHQHSIQLQSSSVSNMEIINGAIVDNIGSPGVSMRCTNASLGSGGGSFDFGNTYGQLNAIFAFYGNNCNFPNGRPAAKGNFNGVPIWDGSAQSPYIYGGSGAFTCTGDHPGIADCTDAPQWATPGMYMLIEGGPHGNGWPIVMSDTTATFAPPPTAQTFYTTFNYGFNPPIPELGGIQTLYVADQVRNWNCVNCTSTGGNAGLTGSSDMADLSQPAAQGVPLYSYTKKTYTCEQNLANAPGAINVGHQSQGPNGNLPVEGMFVSMTVNVITADTTANPSLIMTVGPGNVTNQTTGANSNPFAIINLKIAGTRTVTPSSTSGAQSGDTLNTITGWADNAAIRGPAANLTPGLTPTNYDSNANTTPATACAVWTVEMVTTR
jgi:hypothetical protein